jgi:hypothetical protein
MIRAGGEVSVSVNLCVWVVVAVEGKGRGVMAKQ